MTIAVAQVNTASDTFGQLVQKVNLSLNALAFSVVTTNSNTATGNAAITGTWQSANVFTSHISGGVIGNTGPLTITTNTIFLSNTTHPNILTSDFHVYSGNSVYTRFGPANQAYTFIRKSFGSNTSPTQVTSQTTIGGLVFQALGNTAYQNVATITVSTGASAITDANSAGFLDFNMTPGGNTVPTPRLRLDYFGNFYPLVDGTNVLGGSGNRWNALYANGAYFGNSTVNTAITTTTISTNNITTNTVGAFTANLTNSTITVGNVVTFTSNLSTITTGNVVTLTSNIATITTGNVVTLSSNTATIANLNFTSANGGVLNSNGGVHQNTSLVNCFQNVSNIANTNYGLVLSINTAGTGLQQVASFISAYRGGRITASVSSLVSNAYQVSDLLILNSGGSAFTTEFGVVSSNGNLGVFSSSANATHTLLSFTPTVANTNIKMVLNLLVQ